MAGEWLGHSQLFRSFLRRWGLSGAENPPLLNGIVPVVNVMRSFQEDEANVYSMTTGKIVTANHWPTCALTAGSSTPFTDGSGRFFAAAKHSIEVLRISAFMSNGSGQTGANGLGFYLYTPNGTYLDPPDNGGLGPTPTFFEPGLVLNRTYELPEAFGFAGEAATQVPTNPFTPPVFFQTTHTTGGNTYLANWNQYATAQLPPNPEFIIIGTLGIVAPTIYYPNPVILWDSGNPPLRLYPDQIVAVQPTFSPTAAGWTMFVTWTWRELTTEGL